jgi:hypothetical protein
VVARRQRDRVLAVAAAVFEDGLHAHVAEQVEGVFERVDGVGRRVEVAPEVGATRFESSKWDASAALRSTSARSLY